MNSDPQMATARKMSKSTQLKAKFSSNGINVVLQWPKQYRHRAGVRAAISTRHLIFVVVAENESSGSQRWTVVKP